MRPLAASLLALIVVAHSGPAALVKPTIEGGRDHALFVGCTYSERPARQMLQGCGNDVELLVERFQALLDLPDDRVLTLVEGAGETATRPTLRNIRAALATLEQRARRGDRVLLYFAGHGSQQPDGRDRDEDDGYDEVFLPADMGETKRVRGRLVIENALTDDELYGVIERLLQRGVEVCVFSDACYSATLARGGGRQRTRGLDPALLGLMPEGGRGRGSRARSRPGDELPAAGGFVGLYAVQADELAQETAIDAGDGTERVHGIFTWSLARALSRTNGEATFDDLHRLVIAGYRELGYHEITPFLQGDRGATFVRGEPARSSRFARPVGDRFEVDGGRLHGFEVGSRLELLSADRAQVVAELRVVATSTLRSLAERFGAEPATAAIPEHTRLPVRVLSTPAGGRALSVHIASAGDPEWLGELREQDPAGARVTLVSDPATADWTCERDADSWILWAGSERAQRRYRVPTASVASTLLDLHRVSNLLRLPARSQPLPDGLLVELRVVERGPDGKRSEGAPLVDGATVIPGSDLQLRVVNRTATELDLWVFWIDSNHGVTRVFPDPDVPTASPFLVPARKTRERTFDVKAQEVSRIVTDLTQGHEHFLFLAVPHPTADLGFLASDSLAPDARGGDDGSAALWDELAFGPAEGAQYARQLEAGTYVALLPLRMTWEPARTPAHFDGRRLALPEPAAAPVAPGPGQPPALGDEAFVLDRGGLRVVADRADRPRLLLVDLDPPSLVSDDELGAQLRAGTFPAELAIAYEPERGRRSAYYDTARSSAPRFDLVRFEENGDGRADRELRYTDDAWREREAPAAPWLRVAELDYYDIAGEAEHAKEDAMLRLLRFLFRTTKTND
jgi:hypothetical protein